MALEPTPWGDFRAHLFPPIEYILGPWLPTRGLGMVSGHRGIGKTFFTTSLAWAIATGGSCMGYPAGKPRSVCYVDGEMDPAELQERFVGLEKASLDDGNGSPALAGGNLGILTHAAFEFGLPDVADRAGQDLFDSAIGDREVVILDNLSCLVTSGNENDAESWMPIQEWLLSMRRDGKTTILVHHTGKPQGEHGTFSQRGTSAREGPLNASIMLTHPRIGERAGALSMTFTKLRRVDRDFGMDIEAVRKGRSLQVEADEERGTRVTVNRKAPEAEQGEADDS